MGVLRSSRYLGRRAARKGPTYMAVAVVALGLILVSGRAFHQSSAVAALYAGYGMKQPAPAPQGAIPWINSPASVSKSMSSASSRASTVPVASAKPCLPGDLQVVGSHWAAAAGTEGVVVTLVNRSTVSCSIHQYPRSVGVEPNVGSPVASSTTANANNAILTLSPQESVRIGIEGSFACSGQDGRGAVQARDVTISGSETGNLTATADQFTFTPACGIRTTGYSTTVVAPTSPPAIVIRVELPVGAIRPGTSFTYFVTLTNNTTQTWVTQSTCPTYTERLFEESATVVNKSYTLNCKAGPLTVGNTATYAIQMTIPSSAVANPIAKMTFEFPSFDAMGGGVVKIS